MVGIGVNLVSAPDLPDRSTFAFADAGVAMRDGDRISGIAQVGGLWIPPMGFTRLRQGQTIDTAPVTGAKITVAAVDDAFVTFREQAAGYSADYWYNRTSGALSHVRFVDKTAGQIVDQKRTH